MKKYNKLTIEIIATADVTTTSTETEFIPFDNTSATKSAYELN